MIRRAARLPAMDPETLPLVAIDTMNAVHKDEVALVNALLARLQRAAGGDHDWAAVDQALIDLLQHMEDHFAAEEARMRTEAFPPYPVHKAEHDRMRALSAEVAEVWRRERDVRALQIFWEEDFPAWLWQHIATMDTFTAGFFRARECTGAGA